jgi:choline dehydrogenase
MRRSVVSRRKVNVYDFIVIGAGSAGCVLAHRLVKAGFRVALVEAGGSDRKLEIQMPAGFTKLFKTAYDWNYQTLPQPALGGRQLYWPRGKVVGGSSSLNAQMWLPGYPSDFDAWAEASNSGWDWQSVRPFLEKAERRLGAASSKLEPGISIAALRDPNPASSAFLKACEEIGLPEFSAFSTERPEGYALTSVTQRRGRRFSAADGYLRAVRRHKNLKLILNAHVRRIVLEGRRAVGVTYQDVTGRGHTIRAEREVLLSAGTVNSPQLLMLSGIGDREHLTQHGITVLHHLPGVGKNLQDHLLAAVIVNCPKPVTLVAAESIMNLLRYLVLGRGMLTSNVGEGFAFVRTRPELALPDIELIFAPGPFIDHGLVKPTGHGVTLGAVLLQPESRGRIELRSKNPVDAPHIDARYLSDPAGSDLRTLIAGVKYAQRILKSHALREYVGSALEPGPDVESDAALADFIREQAETLYHPIGTCRMGADEDAVVDASLRVHGLEGLRVIDASIMPRIVRGHTHAGAVMIAERAADLVIRSPQAQAGSSGK